MFIKVQKSSSERLELVEGRNFLINTFYKFSFQFTYDKEDILVPIQVNIKFPYNKSFISIYESISFLKDTE